MNRPAVASESNSVIERLESEVRSYCRLWESTICKASGETLFDVDGKRYIDFFSGAGSLNYGHNHPEIRARLIDYLMHDGVVHFLDVATSAKTEFLSTFEHLILKPRQLEYKIQFPGPTGTNSVESALKLARKVKQREQIVCFTNAFHGMSLGALAATGNSAKRKGAGISLHGVQRLPYDGYFGTGGESLDLFEAMLADASSGIDRPAAVILETVQAEGGVNVASGEWLERLEALCRVNDILIILDDIQTGCGRTGPFFSFEGTGIQPDMICLSKSISGFGLPMALVLIKPEYDLWSPGEHNGTFRGNNAAFVTATEALRLYWSDDTLSQSVISKGQSIRQALDTIRSMWPDAIADVRGKGLIFGVEMVDAPNATHICKTAFAKGLMLETAGSEDQVVKLLPPLTIDESNMALGMDILIESFESVLGPQIRSTISRIDVAIA